MHSKHWYLVDKSGRNHAPAAVSPGKEPSVSIQIGSRTDLDVVAGERLALTGTKSRPTKRQPVTLLTELSRLIKMNSRSDKTKCEGSVNASGTINKKWLELIWLLHIRCCKTKDVICYQRYNDPSQGLLQSLTFTISI